MRYEATTSYVACRDSADFSCEKVHHHLHCKIASLPFDLQKDHQL